MYINVSFITTKGDPEPRRKKKHVLLFPLRDQMYDSDSGVQIYIFWEVIGKIIQTTSSTFVVLGCYIYFSVFQDIRMILFIRNMLVNIQSRSTEF